MTGLDPDAGAADVCAALMQGDAGGVVDARGNVSIRDIQSLARAAAAALGEAGVSAYEPVLVPVSGRAEDVAAILGALHGGAVAVPVHERAHADTIIQIREATAARFALHLTNRDDPAGASIERLAEEPPPSRPLLDGAAFITFTSGSTGRPKGVVLSRARMSAKLASIQEVLAMPAGAMTVSPLQLIFSFGQWVTFLTLLNGGTVRLSERFDAGEIAEALEHSDYLAAVPTMLRMLLEGEGSHHRFDILTGGEAVSAGLRDRLFETWPKARVHSIFGLTETGTCDLFRLDTAETPSSDSLGYPGPGIEVRTDPDTSELQIRTPFAMLGYLDMPEATAAPLKDGWLHTGDAAEILSDGEVRLVGRLKELINRAGNKVSPLEVEALYAEHPDVAAVLATGVPDERLGEAIHLLVVPKAGAAIDPDALRDWGRGKADAFKLPDVVHVGKAIPLGKTGKSDRGALRRLIEHGEPF